MGGPMAAHLARAGFRVQGYDLDPGRLAALAKAGGRACSSVAQACDGAQVLITMLPRDEHVRGVLLGEQGVAEHAGRGALVLEMSTILPRTSLDIAAALRDRGLRMMDAPVGRTPADARAGKLLVMAGGDAADFDEAHPVFDAFADKILHMGPLGSGIRMKVANNYMSMVGMVLTAETLAMAEKAGIDTAAAVEVLQNTAAGRGQINVNFPRKVLAGDVTPDFPLSLGHKDLSLGLSLGHELGTPLFLGACALELFGMAPALGRADQDCTAMLLILRQLAGMDPAGGDACASRAPERGAASAPPEHRHSS